MASENILRASQMVKATMAPILAEGHSVECAVAYASDMLGTSPRRTRAFWNGEVRNVEDSEMKDISDSFWTFLPRHVFEVFNAYSRLAEVSGRSAGQLRKAVAEVRNVGQ